MRGRRLMVGLVAAGLLPAVAGCATGDGGAAEGPRTTTTASVSIGATGSPGTLVFDPAQLTVHRPGFVDIDRSADDLPVWPGPDPAEFLKPNPPRGETGELTGLQARDVFVAAQHNSDALWNVAGTVQWLVVVPLS